MVSPIYKRDLDRSKYFGGYQRHPYVSFYTGRGCKSRCTFCLWPQTIGGHNYRHRTVPKVIEEVKYILKEMPEVKEIFFDDDTLTDAHDLVVELSGELAKLGFGKPGFPVTWGCNAKANVPRSRAQGDEGGRLPRAAGRLRERQPADPAQHQEGPARRRRAAVHQGLRTRSASTIHGTFILGLPGETLETIEETIKLRRTRSIRTPSRCRWRRPIPAPSSTSRRSRTSWFDGSDHLLTDGGNQIAQLSYPHLSSRA